jgi:uncharacterized protein YecE (DUF72 family)
MTAETTSSNRANPGRIRVGIGGWSYAPWRGVFYPKGLKQADELAYAASKLTSIEINATFYRTQSPESFRKWAEAVPDDFVFSVKGHQKATHQKDLAASGDSIKWFLRSGVLRLGEKLGPILWQFPPFKRFDEQQLEAFLRHLPQTIDGRRLNHVIEARHTSFATPDFVRLLRESGVAAVYSDAEAYPSIPDVTGDVVYARLQRGEDKLPTAYAKTALDLWAERGKAWAQGATPPDLAHLDASPQAESKPRDVFMYFIHEGKLRAPAAATALIERLG